ncbi:MAG: type II toxin-antitoxin system PemK/MazF family toxin [Planctomycetes bacterium]|nr:type II toxin-antitoxin system PemK/MazF family toxin [Planctomycetota bacterium]
MVRGDIFFINLKPRTGSEQSGMRPAILVSHDSFNSVPSWRSVTIIPFTTSRRWLSPSPTTVLFRRGEFGLPRECAALAHQITTIDRNKMVLPALGRVTGLKLDEVDGALRNYLNL